MIRRALAVLFLAAVVVVGPASSAWALKLPPIPRITIPTPIGPISTPSVNCKPPPPIRDSATGVSAMFDGAPADTGGQPASTVYEKYGVHPFSWAVYDPGCAGDVAQPWATTDTYIGDMLLGVATDIAAFANGVHNLVVHPTWLGAFDKVETRLTDLLKQNVFDVLLPVMLTVVGLLIMVRSLRGSTADAFRMAAWALLVIAVVAVVANEPVRIGRLADSVETQGVNSVNAAVNGGNANPAAAGSLEVNILNQAWLQGEVGSSTDQTAIVYGPKLLDGQAYQWSQLQNGQPVPGVTGQKQKEFQSAASAIQKNDPAAYDQLKGQAGGRMGAGAEALLGVLLTVPFRLVADLLVVASLLLLRLEVMFLPVLAVVAIHHRYRHVLTRGVVAVTIAALFNAFVFSTAAAINTVVVGFLLSGNSGIPMWFGLVLAGLLAVVLFAALRPFRRLTRMATAAEVSQHVGRAVTGHTERVKTQLVAAGKAAAAAAGAGPAAAAGAVVGAVRQNAAHEDDSQFPVIEPWISSGSGAEAAAPDGPGRERGEAAPRPRSGSTAPENLDSRASDVLPENGGPEPDVTPETEDPDELTA